MANMAKRFRQHALIGLLQLSSVKRRILALLKTPFFWLISLWGNACICGGAVLFYRFEFGKNPAIQDALDCLLWAVGIATTVGGGNIYAVTQAGKVLSILMMMGGSIFLWSYMALFVGAFVDPELKDIEREVSELQQERLDSVDVLKKLRVLVQELESPTRTKR